VDLQSSTTLDVAAGSRLTISGPITSAAMGITLTKAGAGSAEVSRVRADTLALNDGMLRVLPDGSDAATSRLHNLAIAQSAPEVSAARLDLTNNSMVDDYAYGSASPLANIANRIREGYNGGAWDGNGIATSMGNSGQFGLGFGEASALRSVPSIFGTVDDTAVLVRFTRYGDANLDDSVDTVDFNLLASNFSGTNKAWSDADFNYDTIVDTVDFNLLASNFGQSIPAQPLTALVPEPIGVPALMGLLPLIMRMRRS
jgi:hypothetical protein